MIHARFRSGIAVAGLTALAVIHNTSLINQQPAAELVIKMKSTVASHAEAFFDTGHGFNEAESWARNVSLAPDEQVLFFPIPAKTVYSIRFDPLQVPGTVEI